MGIASVMSHTFAVSQSEAAPGSDLVPQQERVVGILKWYRPIKGYGFLTLVDSRKDAILHSRVVCALDLANLLPGATIECDVEETSRGLSVTKVHRVDGSTAHPSARSHQAAVATSGDTAPEGLVAAVVKWFHKEEGYGFFANPCGGEDIYIHANVLRDAGYAAELDKGQVWRIGIGNSEKGQKVVAIAEGQT